MLFFIFAPTNNKTPMFVNNAEVAQLVELQPSKLVVASSSLVFRSKNPKSKDLGFFIYTLWRVPKLRDSPIFIGKPRLPLQSLNRSLALFCLICLLKQNNYMQYNYLLYSFLFLIGAVLYYKAYKQQLKDRKEKMGQTGFQTIDVKVAAFLVLTYLIGSALYYFFKFII